MLVLLFIAAAVFMPKNVFAINCDLVANVNSGTYTIAGERDCTVSEDITIEQPFTITEGTVTITLDHNITSNTIIFNVRENGNLVINGPGSITTTGSMPPVIFDSTGNLSISGGTFNGGVQVQKANRLLISGGAFSGSKTGASISNVGNLTINGGTFTGSFSGASIIGEGTKNVSSGTFEGGKLGILTDRTNETILRGGTFKSTDDESYAIGILTTESRDTGFFNNIVGRGSHYSEKFTALRKKENDITSGIEGVGSSTADPSHTPTIQYYYVSDIKNVSVVTGASTEDQKIDPAIVDEEEETEKAKAEETSENPKTGSTLYIYVIAFLLVSGLAVFGTYKYQKKLEK